MAKLGRFLILGNWKMHLTQQAAAELAAAIAAQPQAAEVTAAIFPPFTALHSAAQAVKGSAVLLGGQDCHGKDEGAFTGNVSAPMLRDAGCGLVIVGHSERRAQGETSAQVQEKAEAALRHGLHAIVCIGESAALREQGGYLEFLTRQLHESLPETAARDKLSIAYEPIWAIGTGKTATAENIREVHEHIRQELGTLNGEKPRILYGGSVKANNALEILSLPVVDGVLVGGASLDASAFSAILEAAAQIDSNRASGNPGQHKAIL